MKQHDHPAHNMPAPLYSGTELGALKLKNAMYSAQEDDGSWNFAPDRYNTQMAGEGIRQYKTTDETPQ